MPALFMSLTKTATYKMAAVHPQLRFHDFQMSVLTKLGHKSTEKKPVVSLLFFLLLFFSIFYPIPVDRSHGDSMLGVSFNPVCLFYDGDKRTAAVLPGCSQSLLRISTPAITITVE